MRDSETPTPDIECRQPVEAHEEELMGAVIRKLNVKPGDVVTLTIPKKGNRWGIPRINKLAKVVRQAGGELAVMQEGTSLYIG